MSQPQKDVQVFSWGLIYLSACAGADATAEDVERQANVQHSTGLDHGWRYTGERFATGQENPCACNDDSSKRHWLLSC